MTGYAMSTLARFEAGRGDVVACRNLMDRALRQLGPYGVEGLLVQVDAVLGFAALTAGDPETAAQHLECARLAEQADVDGLTFTSAAALRYRGLLAANTELATASFVRARSLPGLDALPFERARTLLCEAEALRRLHRPVLARQLLLQARSTFAELGAKPWVTRAESELAATGVEQTGHSRPQPYALTPRELEIARSVAAGLNNAEAAAAHFISRRTVEAHLARIYHKLGVRSRTELACKLRPTSGEVPPGVTPWR
jgi:DNA-binding CsgD family transcriptional regulator